MRIFILAIFILASFESFSQDTRTRYVDITTGGGSRRGTVSASFIYTWKLGAARKFGVGVGGRITSFVGRNLYYITAPASLTSGSTSPFIIFKQNINKNIDSLFLKSPGLNSINLCINLDYKINTTWTIGFNIDAIGFTFGSTRAANYINEVSNIHAKANPTAFNVLLVSDNDRGTLNSELYARYFLTKEWAIKIATQFIFTEYTTDTEIQQYPVPNDRFRNKSLLLAIGLSYHFNRLMKL